MPIGKVWIYRLLFICVCLYGYGFLGRGSQRRQILHGGSSASLARNLPFLWTLLPQKPKIGRIGERAGHDYPHVNITVEMSRRKRHARDAPFVKLGGVWT